MTLPRRGYPINVQAENASESLHQVGYPAWEHSDEWQAAMTHCVRVAQEGNDSRELYRQFVMVVKALKIDVPTPDWSDLTEKQQTGFDGFISVVNTLNGVEETKEQ